jgi:ribose 5-phosphate isomerase B
MRIALGSDHAGYGLKSVLAAHLAEAGHQVEDLGADSADLPVDYPDMGYAVGVAVAGDRAEAGVCVCGTGIGIAIAANKVPGVRAAVVHDVTTARLAREHNDANVLCLGARVVGEAVAVEALDTFVATVFAAGRHQRRIDGLARLDRPVEIDPSLLETPEPAR